MPDVLGHPTRIRLLYLLATNDSVSPVDASKELGISLTTVAYHVRWLYERKLLKIVGRRQRRGAVQHFYTLELGCAEWPAVLADSQQRIALLGDLEALASRLEASTANPHRE